MTHITVFYYTFPLAYICLRCFTWLVWWKTQQLRTCGNCVRNQLPDYANPTNMAWLDFDNWNPVQPGPQTGNIHTLHWSLIIVTHYIRSSSQFTQLTIFHNVEMQV